MGRFTEEMTRLTGEIVAARGERRTFVQDLTRDVAAMQANLRRTHQEMARKARGARRAATSRLRKTVGGMRHAWAADLQGARRAWNGK